MKTVAFSIIFLSSPSFDIRCLDLAGRCFLAASLARLVPVVSFAQNIWPPV